MFTSLKRKIFHKKEAEIRKSGSVLQIVEELEEDNPFKFEEDDEEEESPFDRVNRMPKVIGDMMPKKRGSRLLLLFDSTSPSTSSTSLTVSSTPRTPKGFSKYTIIGPLHRERSAVLLAEYFDEESRTVVKVIIKQQALMSPRKRQFLSNAKMENMIQKELNDETYMSNRGYPFIVKYIDEFKCIEYDEHYIVMEYCDCGTIMDLHNDLIEPYDLDILRRFFMDILLGLEFMHNQGIVHRDIKPDNIFLHFNGSRVMCKIGDFGLSIVLQPGVIDVGAVGSTWYLAPEIIQSARVSDPKSVIRDPFLADVWAFGVTVYGLSELSYPFQPDPPSSQAERAMREAYGRSGRMTTEEMTTLYDNIITNQRRERDYNLDDIQFNNFINSMLEHHVPMRLHVSQLLLHPFMKGDMRNMNMRDYLMINRKGEWSPTHF